MSLVVTLLVAGVVLLALETVLPGMIAGIVGFLCLLAGVIAGFVEFGTRTGTNILFAVLAGLVLGTFCWIKYFPDSRLAKRFVSQRTVGEIGTAKPELLHQTGVAFTPLRPSGTAVINQHRVDVVTEGSFLERGAAIKVVAVEGLRVVVRAV